MRRTSDLENFMIATEPGGIEASEARGQKELCQSSELPRDCGDRALLEKNWGVKFGEESDDIFVKVTLPAGWKIKPTDHSMRNNLCDEKGRKRASIFYKAAFYDRHAHMRPDTRYRIEGDYQGQHPNSKTRYIAKDGDTILFTGEFGGDDRYEKSDAGQWLTSKFPDWQNPFAYWED